MNALALSMSGAAKKFDGIIPLRKLIVEACRSSGPGGQHVNKKNTKVSVSFHVASADWLPKETRDKLGESLASKIGKDGYLTIRSDKTREQTMNVADCMDKLRSYINEAEEPPEPELSPETIEIKKKQLERANAERLRAKRIASQKRQMMSKDIW